MRVFNAEIKKDNTNRLTFIDIPFNPKEIFHKPKGTIFVSGAINDTPYRNKLLSRGDGKYILVVNKALQKSIGFSGQVMTAHITMFPDVIDTQSNSVEKSDTVSCSMDVITAIKTRKSIRRFTPEPISDAILNTILSAALDAPSAKGKRPCHFVIIKDIATLCELARNNRNASMLECAAATQNMLLCTHGLGLGGVWCGIAANSNWQKQITERLNLPLKIEPITMIALGYSDEDKAINDTWDASKIHHNNW